MQHPAAQPGHGQLIRAGPDRAGSGPDRGALFRPRPVPAGGRFAGRHGRNRPSTGGDRAGPLRHGLPTAHGVRACGGLAGGPADGDSGRRALGAGAGGAAGAGFRGGAVPDGALRCGCGCWLHWRCPAARQTLA